ncbi:MAG: orotidine 5'-phosphate decarboxylase / HUMPS family protein [Coriobacteriaceae bacterium]|nr:orotidine 5'-phosphate decarboxylase / HUMPS family protein [Coriobacteriaceae bacterium]
MKLQVTLDTPSIDHCSELVELIHEYVDVVEVGNPLIIESGLSLVQELRNEFPQIGICADAKIVNSGHYIASRCFDRGASIVTIMGVAPDQTVEGAVAAAELAGGEIMADLTGIADVATRARELEELGVRYLCAHTGFEDRQLASNPLSDAQPGITRRILTALGYDDPLRELDLIRANTTGAALPAIVGRIDEENIDQVVERGPELILIGRAIVGAVAPAQAAADLREHFVSVG